MTAAIVELFISILAAGLFVIGAIMLVMWWEGR